MSEPSAEPQPLLLSQRLPHEMDRVHAYGLLWVLTCSACPEQYDVYLPATDGTVQQVGYLRLRGGVMRVDYPDAGGKTVYTAHPQGDGTFDTQERARYMRRAAKRLLRQHGKQAVEALWARRDAADLEMYEQVAAGDFPWSGGGAPKA